MTEAEIVNLLKRVKLTVSVQAEIAPEPTPSPAPQPQPESAPLPPAPPALPLDRFGIVKLYPSLAGGKDWTSQFDNGVPRSFGWAVDPSDTWLDCAHGDATYRIDGAGVMRITGVTPRIYVHDPGNLDQWRNVEITMYGMRIGDSGISYGGLVAVCRSNHGISGPETQNLCDTRGYSARVRYDGHIDFEKEVRHGTGWAARNNKEQWPRGMPLNVWIGSKFVCYDQPDGSVKLEHYIDLIDGEGGGDWKLVNQIEDDGTFWGAGLQPCAVGIDPAAKLDGSGSRAGSESGKPNLACYFRSDGIANDGLWLKKLSIREIE